MQGSITKRDKRGETWLIRVSLGRDANGKRIYRSETFHGKKAGAHDRLRDLIDEFKTHGADCPEASRELLHEYLIWWAERTRDEVRPRTAANRVKCINTYFPSDPAVMKKFRLTDLGRLPLGKITPTAIDEHLASLRRPKADGTPRLGHSSMKKLFSILRQALRYAVRKKKIAVNPASSDLIDVPRAPKATKALALTVEQAQTFLQFAALDRFRALWFVALFTGCRPGELLGLEWKHIDLQKAEVRVEQSLYRPKGGGWTITAPKTPKSRRTIPIPVEVVEELQRHKLAQDIQRLAWRIEHDRDFVFTAYNGSPLVSNHVTVSNLHPLAKKAGLPVGLNLYSLRHSHATLMLHAGNDARLVADRLGHADVRQVLETYYHPPKEAQRDATAKMGATLLGSQKPSPEG
ncbi:MAG: site-specific integrase [Candidatus Xenobia bacterium]